MGKFCCVCAEKKKSRLARVIQLFKTFFFFKREEYVSISFVSMRMFQYVCVCVSNDVWRRFDRMQRQRFFFL